MFAKGEVDTSISNNSYLNLNKSLKDELKQLKLKM
jgi:hypothetical protein